MTVETNLQSISDLFLGAQPLGENFSEHPNVNPVALLPDCINRDDLVDILTLINMFQDETDRLDNIVVSEACEEQVGQSAVARGLDAMILSGHVYAFVTDRIGPKPEKYPVPGKSLGLPSGVPKLGQRSITIARSSDVLSSFPSKKPWPSHSEDLWLLNMACCTAGRGGRWTGRG